MSPLVALVREPSATLAECALSYLQRTPIDLFRARSQHAGYCAALRAAGAEVRVLPALDHLADAVFVEDTAVIVDELAVLGAPGEPARAPEADAIEPAIRAHRPVRRLSPSRATLEGGDVLRAGRTLFVGRSRRTNEAGVEALRHLLEPLGYRVIALRVEGCLHLKTACSAAADTLIVVNPAWVDRRVFEREGLDTLPVAPGEPWAANVLRVSATLLVARGHPATLRRLRGAGLDPVELDIGEFQKAEAGLTCLSLLVTEGA